MTHRRVFSVIALMLILMLVSAVPGAAAEKEKPERGMVAAMRYPGIFIGPDDKVRADLVVKNIGRSNETIVFEILEKPEGWDAQIKSYGDTVTGVFLAEDEDRTMTLNAQPEGKKDKLPPGKYQFKIKASTADGLLAQTTSLEVTVLEQEKVKEAIKLTTSYPVLRGPSDAKFEFSLDVENDSGEDTLFNLAATAPEGWEVSFKPAYEQKQISSLQIKANQNRSVGVEVTPPAKAEAGEYPVKVRVQSPKAKQEVVLTVALTGTYKLKTGTPDGILSMTAQKGKSANMSIYVRNDGSATQKRISFLSFKPENWKVEFKPETVENLKGGEFKQVEVVVTPADEALVGDYSVAVSVQGEKASDEAEFRVTVKASSAWGWIGIAIIVFVVLGLALAFRRLGRR